LDPSAKLVLSVYYYFLLFRKVAFRCGILSITILLCDCSYNWRLHVRKKSNCVTRSRCVFNDAVYTGDKNSEDVVASARVRAEDIAALSTTALSRPLSARALQSV